MNPDIPGWPCEELVEQTRHHVALSRRRTVGLKDMVRAMLPDSQALLKSHHDAGADSRMAWRVLRELSRHAAAARVASGPADNRTST